MTKHAYTVRQTALIVGWSMHHRQDRQKSIWPLEMADLQAVCRLFRTVREVGIEPLLTRPQMSQTAPKYNTLLRTCRANELGEVMLENLSSVSLGHSLPYKVINGLAWHVAAELIRRNPTKLRVIETHPGGGQYDCLSVLTRDRTPKTLLNLNRVGSLHIFGYPNRDNENAGISLNWLRILQIADLREELLRPIETNFNLSSPKKSPPTTRQSIGVRVLARLSGMQVFANKDWDVRNGYLDSSGCTSGPNEWARTFDGPDWTPLESDLQSRVEYRYWFLMDYESKPRAAFDVDRGLGWDHAGHRLDLLEEYSRYKSLDALIEKVCPRLE